MLKLSKSIVLVTSRGFARRKIIEETIYRELWRNLRNRYWKAEFKIPPYDHTCQVGDPVLRVMLAVSRCRASKGKDIQNLVKTMVKVMRKTGGVGLAAPQIGVGKQVIIAEFTKKHAKVWTEEKFAAREALLFPLKVFINPELKVLDSRQITLPEGCLSIKGFYANVPRAYKVEISGYNEHAEHVTWTAHGYSARILQHEVDHLRGNLFIDIMDTKTFGDELWPRWNLR
ncbi:putative peptide deformylase, mitochondrial-like [Apostichopus japonicus]|uniref:Peptide deformylase n=1 Tax=Stichopus japonicus TaxID=307972 RepID=A0A2G8KPW3_STIJA|nr:putative peptide deformylase, mitochondrial-like [Apostichopus japonicus]